MSIKVAFLDRDGVINHDVGYVYKIEDFEFIDGVIEALEILQKKGYALIIVTNQSGIGRGYYSESDYQTLTSAYRNLLADKGIEILDVFHCPHHPTENCECRKPKSGLFMQAFDKYDINIEKSLMFGDKLTDMQAAGAAGINNNFLLTQKNQFPAVDSSIIFKAVPSLWHCVSQGSLP